MPDRLGSEPPARHAGMTIARYATRLATLLAITLALGGALGLYGRRIGLSPVGGGMVMGLVVGVLSIALLSPRAPARARVGQALGHIGAGAASLAAGSLWLAQLTGLGLGFLAVGVGLLAMAATGRAGGEVPR